MTIEMPHFKRFKNSANRAQWKKCDHRGRFLMIIVYPLTPKNPSRFMWGIHMEPFVIT